MVEDTDVNSTRHGSAARAAKPDRGRYDGNKPCEQIEYDIARTRLRLSAAIEALEDELAPRRVIENGAEVLRDALEPRSGALRDEIRAYAIPLALIATGLGWLFVLRHRHWRSDLAAGLSETPAEPVETGETPTPAGIYANVVDPPEPAPLTDK